LPKLSSYTDFVFFPFEYWTATLFSGTP